MMRTVVPEPINSRVQQEGWIPLEQLGEGGGGKVFLCVNAELIKMFQEFMRHSGPVSNTPERAFEICSRMVRGLDRSLVDERIALAALKIPKELDVPATRERLKREIAAMQAISHPSLIRLLGSDSQDPPEWFTMELHKRGTLANCVKGYHGKIASSLEAIRPIAEGVGLLHEKGYVHRDIKPNNIFLSETGRLVLGDFGIIFPKEEAGDRLTNTGMTLFSRDWVPDWTRFNDDKPEPKMDVFMLAKVIYYMVTGGGKVLASQLDEEEFDLRYRLKGIEGSNELQEFLMSFITTKERDCKLTRASDFLARLDELLNQVTGRSHWHPIFSFLSAHETTNIPVRKHPEENPRYASLRAIEVLFPARCKTLRARARLTGPSSGTRVALSFSIDGIKSGNCQEIELHPDRGIWTKEFGLDNAFSFSGWHKLDVNAKAENDGVQISGFMLYGQ